MDGLKDFWEALGLGGALAFLYAWVIRNTAILNKTARDLAVNTEADNSRSLQISEIKTDIQALTSSVNQLNSAITKWRSDDGKIFLRMETQYKTISELEKLVHNYDERDRAQNTALLEIINDKQGNIKDNHR